MYKLYQPGQPGQKLGAPHLFLKISFSNHLNAANLIENGFYKNYMPSFLRLPMEKYKIS